MAQRVNVEISQCLFMVIKEDEHYIWKEGKIFLNDYTLKPLYDPLWYVYKSFIYLFCIILSQQMKYYGRCLNTHYFVHHRMKLISQRSFWIKLCKKKMLSPIKILFWINHFNRNLPTTVNSILSSSSAIATMTRTRRLDPLHRIIHDFAACHDTLLSCSGWLEPDPPGSVDCILNAPRFYCKKKTKNRNKIIIKLNYSLTIAKKKKEKWRKKLVI